MRSSDQLDQLATALAKAQAAFSVAKKEHEASVKMRDGGSYGYSYADLPIVVAACRKALTDNGIAVVQSATAADRLVSVCTRLIHASGQWISDEDAPLAMTARDASPQSIGSAITYARRYALMAMVGVVASDEDDDGAEASRDWTPPQQRPPAQQRPTTTAPRPPERTPGADDDDGPEVEAEACRKALLEAKSKADIDAIVRRIMRLPDDLKAKLRNVYERRVAELKAAA
jgi:hypothetical protein